MSKTFKGMSFVIDSAEQSIRLQEVLFKLGYRWLGNGNPEFRTEVPEKIDAWGDGDLTFCDADYATVTEHHELTNTEEFIRANGGRAKDPAPVSNRHPHYDLIVAYYSDITQEVQFLQEADECHVERWVDATTPTWNPNIVYRLKTKTKTVYHYVYQTEYDDSPTTTWNAFESEEDFLSTYTSQGAVFKWYQRLDQTAKTVEVK